MRTRKLDDNGDVVYGQGFRAYEVNTPMAVGLAVEFRMQLFQGEWFLDTGDGTPWDTQVLGKYTQARRGPALRARILGTPNVQSLDKFSMSTAGRAFSYLATVTTVYGNSSLAVTSIQPV
jgi:hypothetical protein